MAPNGAAVELPDIVLAAGDGAVFDQLPEPTFGRTLDTSDLVSGFSDVPVFWGLGGSVVLEQRILRIPADLLGTAFILLTRADERYASLDEHGRVRSQETLLGRSKTTAIPVVDRYVALLAAALNHISPGIAKFAAETHLRPTHDVDVPFLFLGRGWRRIRQELKVRLRSQPLAAMRYAAAATTTKLRLRSDPYDQFDAMMRAAEDKGVRAEFYFKAAEPGPYDDYYDLNSRIIRGLLKKVQRRGHVVGFHPGYSTYNSPERFAEELERLQRAAGVQILGGRQHYLRARFPQTWRLWADHHLQYDSSLAFSDILGFRAGTAYPFRVFDIEARRPLDLEERPLLLMERTLTSPQYLGLDEESALHAIAELAAAMRPTGGHWTILWHNSALDNAMQWRLFRYALAVF